MPRRHPTKVFAVAEESLLPSQSSVEPTAAVDHCLSPELWSCTVLPHCHHVRVVIAAAVKESPLTIYLLIAAMLLLLGRLPCRCWMESIVRRKEQGRSPHHPAKGVALHSHEDLLEGAGRSFVAARKSPCCLLGALHLAGAVKFPSPLALAIVLLLDRRPAKKPSCSMLQPIESQYHCCYVAADVVALLFIIHGCSCPTKDHHHRSPKASATISQRWRLAS